MSEYSFLPPEFAISLHAPLSASSRRLRRLPFSSPLSVFPGLPCSPFRLSLSTRFVYFMNRICHTFLVQIVFNSNTFILKPAAGSCSTPTDILNHFFLYPSASSFSSAVPSSSYSRSFVSYMLPVPHSLDCPCHSHWRARRSLDCSCHSHWRTSYSLDCPCHSHW
jgi:hypothetical protein